MIAELLLVLGLLMFALAYHNIDLSYNNKFSFIDVGNGLNGVQMHSLGLVMMFLGAVSLSAAFIIKKAE